MFNSVQIYSCVHTNNIQFVLLAELEMKDKNYQKRNRVLILKFLKPLVPETFFGDANIFLPEI